MEIISKIKQNKSGVAFSILGLFLVFLIFAFGSLYLFQEDFTTESNYREARIIYVNSEIDYFKKTYIKNSLSFSLYNTFNELILYLNQKNKFNLISQDTELLNKLIFEGLTNGSFQGTNIPNLNNKNINILTNSFKQNFEENYKGNFSYKLLNLTIFETQGYFVDVQIVSQYKIETQDKLSCWEFTDENIIQIPVADLLDPEFIIQGKKNLPIRSSEFHLPSNEWTHYTFNESILNQYSAIFYKPDFDYTIGQSYLQRLLNTTYGGFYGVIGKYTFDKDNIKGGVTDASQNLPLGIFYGDTQVLTSFDNRTRTGNKFASLISYQNPIQILGSTNCSNLGNIYQNFCTFNDTTDYMEIENISFPVITFKENFSTSIWVKFDINTISTQTILRTPAFKIQILSPSIDKHYFAFNFNSVSGIQTIPSNYNLISNTWYHLITSYNGTHVTFYIDGSKKETYPANHANIQSSNSLLIGKSIIGENLIGSIDELGIYSRYITDIEASNLYHKRKIYQLDYIDTEFKKGIEFDGGDDFIIIPHSNSLNFGTSDFSICTWFKTPKIFGSRPFQQLFSKRNNPKNLGNFGLEIDLTTKKLKATINEKFGFSNKQLESDKYYFACMVRNGNVENLYLNGQLDKTFTITGENINSDKDLYIGDDQYLNQNYKGIIDELKIYNRPLSQKEITLNYRNYRSFGKGCCNYITLVNQNKLNYKTGAHFDKISSSSSIFYNHYSKGINYDITLYKSTNFTSLTNTEDYYNLLLDDCLLASYNFFDYDPKTYVLTSNAYNVGLPGNNKCSNLIKQGIY